MSRHATIARSTVCPWCGGPAEASYTDIGVGYAQTSAAECAACETRQVNPEDREAFAVLSEEERQIGWYLPRDRAEGRSDFANEEVKARYLGFKTVEEMRRMLG